MINSLLSVACIVLGTEMRAKFKTLSGQFVRPISARITSES